MPLRDPTSSAPLEPPAAPPAPLPTPNSPTTAPLPPSRLATRDSQLPPPHDWNAVIRDWLPGALRFAGRYGARADAEDLVQAALLKAAAHLHSFRGESKPATWLFGILLNTCRDRPRALPRTPLPDDLPAPPPPPRPDDVTELATIVDREIAALPGRQREALLLSREGLAPADIAPLMRTTDANVRQLLHLARDRLRQRLKPHLEHD